MVLDTMRMPLALAHAESGVLTFENAPFSELFPGDGGGDRRLHELVPGYEPDKAERRFSRGRVYTLEVDREVDGRTLHLALDTRPTEFAGETCLIAEGRDIGKQREAEALLDSYSRMAEKNARQLKREQQRTEKLLLNIMPQSVYDEFREIGTSTPHRFDAATVLMLDFVNFTEMSVSRDPNALIGELNDIYSAFDRIIELHGCERIKTIGDAYVAVSGMGEGGVDHAANVARAALRMRRYIAKRNKGSTCQWHCRIGIATGPVIGAIVGIQKYVYDIFGPAVNLAARLEQSARPMEIVLSPVTRTAIAEEFVVRELGASRLKGFGDVVLTLLEDEARHGDTAIPDRLAG
jgi:class 3 adenylate cyclase